MQFPKTFNTILVQKYIEKKYELRVFYINGKFFSSAIFSQNDEKTKIDFRNYNYEKPNRVVTFELPTKVKRQLEKLMFSLRLKSGSLDLIVNKENQYYFLEVNPVGQFRQVSNPCNFYLEKKIAQNLIKNEK